MVPLRSADGTITAVLGVTRDVTEWKTEALLRQSEDRYRRLLAVLPDAILVNRENRIFFANEQGVRLFGARSAEEILGKSLYDLAHPDYHEMIDARIRHLLGPGNTVPEVEEKIVRLDGMSVDVAVRAARFQDEEGFGILVVLRDISLRKAAEQKLRESEERLQSLLGAMEDVIWSSSLDLSTMFYVSPSVMEIYGRPPDAFLARPSLWLEAVHPDDCVIAEQARQALSTMGSSMWSIASSGSTAICVGYTTAGGSSRMPKAVRCASTALPATSRSGSGCRRNFAGRSAWPNWERWRPAWRMRSAHP